MNATLTIKEPALSDEQSELMRTLAKGGNKDAERVLTLEKAADQENAEAQFYLAHSLQEGALGLTRDPERARKLFARAANNGHPGAQAELDRLEKLATSSLSPKNAGVNVNLPPLAPKQQEMARFDDAIIRLSVRAYMLSMPIFFKENDLVALMADKDNHAHFVEGGLVILYLKTAGSAMAQGEFSPDGENSAERMFGTSAKTQNLAKHADDKMNQMRSQGVALGQDFLWLAGVLPAAAKGDFGPFQAHSQLSPYRQAMLSQIQTWRMSPQVGQQILAQMQQNFSTAEQGLYDAVCQLDICVPADYREPEPRLEPVPMRGESDKSAEKKPGQQENALPASCSQNEEINQCRGAAEQGLAQAQCNLGIMYANGQGVQRDDAEAARWFLRAAEQGLALAENNLGVMYAQGQGVAQDFTKAANWYRKAAEQELPLAQCNLGVMYVRGEGVVQDMTEALKWFRKAAEQGFAQAQCNLGLLYANSDAKEAARWYLKAAEQGLVLAQCNLGLMYEQGRGVEQNNAEAAEWYRKAAEQGDIEGKKRLDRISGK